MRILNGVQRLPGQSSLWLNEVLSPASQAVHRLEDTFPVALQVTLSPALDKVVRGGATEEVRGHEPNCSGFTPTND